MAGLRDADLANCWRLKLKRALAASTQAPKLKPSYAALAGGVHKLAGTTVTGAIVAAAHLAVLKAGSGCSELSTVKSTQSWNWSLKSQPQEELQARNLEADRINIGLLMNERSFLEAGAMK